MRHRLRIFTGEEDTTTMDEPQVRVRFGEIVEALSDALHRNRAWIHDFADDELQVSSDLYDILMAYSHYRPGA